MGCFLFFVGMGFCGFFPSHVPLCILVGFLVWVVFWVLLGWVERFLCLMYYVGVCWLGWDEDGWIHSEDKKVLHIRAYSQIV